jgi:hypothetical protein
VPNTEIGKNQEESENLDRILFGLNQFAMKLSFENAYNCHHEAKFEKIKNNKSKRESEGDSVTMKTSQNRNQKSKLERK